MAAVALAFVGSSIGEAVIGGALGSVIGGALGGGIGSEASGGDFWSGALSGGISAGLGATDFLGLGEPVRNALGGFGLSSGATGAIMSGLQGGLQSSIGGGNFLEGALVGAAMPSVISGAKGLMGWGTAQPAGTQSTPSALSSGIGMANTPSLDSMLGTGQTGAGMGIADPYRTVNFGNTTATATGAATPTSQNFLSNMFNSENVLPTLLNSGVNMYMNQKNANLAKSMAAKADPYAQYRQGDASAYNSLLNNPNAIFDDPVYQAMAKQGDEALMRQAAAMGKTDSGELTNRLSENRMALANQYYNQRLGQYGNGAGVGSSPANAASVYANTRNNNYLYGALTSPLDVWGWNQGRAKVI